MRLIRFLAIDRYQIVITPILGQLCMTSIYGDETGKPSLFHEYLISALSTWYLIAIAEHSMCQSGKPSQDESQRIRWSDCLVMAGRFSFNDTWDGKEGLAHHNP